MSDLRDLYEETILDHNRNPRNFQRVPATCTHEAHGFNPLCGDEFTVRLQVENDVIVDATFDGAGCAISTASASLMTEGVRGKTVQEAERIFHEMHKLLTQGGEHGPLGKLEVLCGVREYPVRVKCATLAWHTLHAALEGEHGTVCTE